MFIPEKSLLPQVYNNFSETGDLNNDSIDVRQLNKSLRRIKKITNYISQMETVTKENPGLRQTNSLLKIKRNVVKLAKAGTKVLNRICSGLTLLEGIIKENDPVKGIGRGLINLGVLPFTGPYEFMGVMTKEFGPELNDIDRFIDEAKSKCDVENEIGRSRYEYLRGQLHLIKLTKKGIIELGSLARQSREFFGDFMLNVVSESDFNLILDEKIKQSTDLDSEIENYQIKTIMSMRCKAKEGIKALEKKFVNLFTNTEPQEKLEERILTYFGYEGIFQSVSEGNEELVKKEQAIKKIFVNEFCSLIDHSKELFAADNFSKALDSLSFGINETLFEKTSTEMHSQSLKKDFNQWEFKKDWQNKLLDSFRLREENSLSKMEKTSDKVDSLSRLPELNLSSGKFDKGMKEALPVSLNKDDILECTGGFPLHNNDIGPILGSGIKLDDQYKKELVNKLKEALVKNPKVLDQCNANAIAEIAENLINAKDLTLEAELVLLDVVDRLLPDERTLAADRESRLGKITKAQKAREKEIAQYINIASDFIENVSYQILGMLKADQAAHEKRIAHDAYGRNFEKCIADLGINAELKEFRGCELKDIRSLLESKLKAGFTEDINIWRKNAEEYEAAVSSTRRSLQECRRLGKTLNDHGFLKKVAKDLRHLQKKHDRKYAEVNNLQRKLKMACVVTSSGAAVLGAVNPVAGALAQGGITIANTCLGAWEHTTQKREQRGQNKINQGYERLSNCVNTVQDARVNMQGQIIYLLERGRSEREFLLYAEGYFTPLRHIALLQGAIGTHNEDKTTIDTEIKNLDIEKEKLDSELKFLERCRNSKTTTKKSLIEVKQRILEVNAALATNKTKRLTAENTLKNWEIDRDNLVTAHEDAVKDMELPKHLRKDADTLTLKASLESSSDYVKNLEAFKNSTNPTEVNLYHYAKATDSHLKIVNGFDQLQKTSDGNLGSVIPGVILSAGKENLSLLQDQALYKSRVKDASDLEEEMSKKVDAATGEEKIKLEEDLAQLRTTRMGHEATLAGINNSITLSEQLTMYSFEKLQQLPPDIRLSVGQQIMNNFSNLTPEEQQSLLSNHAFSPSYCFQLQASAERELLQFADKNGRALIYENGANRCLESREHNRKILEGIEKSDLSTEDKDVLVKRNQQDSFIIQNNLEENIVGSSHEVSQRIIERFALTSNLTKGEQKLVEKYHQFFDQLKQSNIMNQVSGLVSAIEDFVQTAAPEFHESHRPKFALASALTAVGSSVIYWIGSYQKLRDSNEVTALATDGLTPLGIIFSDPSLWMGKLTVPSIEAFTSIVHLIKIGYAVYKGNALPETEQQEIKRRIKEIQESFKDNIVPSLDKINTKLDDIENKFTEQLNENLEELKIMRHEISNNLLKGFSEIKNYQLQEKFCKENRRIQIKGKAGMEKTLRLHASMNTLDSSMGFLNQLIAYSQNFASNVWNGKDTSGITLEEASWNPHLFVGFIAHILDKANSSSLVAPELLLSMGSSFFALQNLIQGSEPSNFKDKIEELRTTLISQCRALIWLYTSYGKQLDETVKSLEAFEFSKKRNARLNSDLNKITLQPVEPIQIQKVIDSFYTAKKLENALSHPLADVISKISQLPQQNFAAFERHQKEEGIKTVFTCGYLAVGSALLLTGPIGLIATGLLATGTLGGIGLECVKDNRFLYDGLSPKSTNHIIKIVNNFFIDKFTKCSPVNTYSSLPNVVHISWVATDLGLEVDQIAYLSSPTRSCSKRVVQNHTVIGKILMIQQESKSFPMLKLETSINWKDNHTAISYYPESYLQAKDLEKIHKIENLTNKINNLKPVNNELLMLDIYGSAAELTLSNGAFNTDLNDSIKKFKSWLGNHHTIPHHQAGQWPLLIPSILFQRMENKIGQELDYYFKDMKTVLQPKFHLPFDKEKQGYQLRISYCDDKGEGFIQFDLDLLPARLVEAVTGIKEANENISLNELMPVLIYHIYGEFWNLRADEKDFVTLEKDQSWLFIGNDSPDQKSLYKKMLTLNPVPVYLTKGKTIQNFINKLKSNFTEDPCFKKYKDNYHMLVALLKLTYEPNDVLNITNALSKGNIPKPSVELFDCSQNIVPDSTKVFELLDSLPKITLNNIETLLGELSKATQVESKPKTAQNVECKQTYDIPNKIAGVQPTTTSNTVSISLNTVKPKGIANLGTSCYINASIQVLFANPEIKKRIANFELPLEKINPSDTREVQLKKEDSNHFRMVMENLQAFLVEYEKAETKSLDEVVAKLRQALREAKVITGLTVQSDVAEVLEYILDGMGISVSLQSQRTTPLFEGVHKEPVQPYQLLQINLKKETRGTFQDLIHEFSSISVQGAGSDPWKYDHNGRQFLINQWNERQVVLGESPSLIHIQLKRFSSENNVSTKIETAFQVTNLEVNLASLFENNVNQKNMYQIKGCIIHTNDNVNQGHYISLVEREGQWYKCDDMRVTPLTLNEVKVELSKGYIFILEKKNTIGSQDAESLVKARNFVAFNECKLKADLGYAEAQRELASCYEEGHGTPLDLISAFKYCKLSADQGFAEAQALLACYYLEGIGIEFNADLAFHYASLGADQGDPAAEMFLSICYEEGLGTPINEPLSFEYFERSQGRGTKDDQALLEEKIAQ